MNTIIVDDEPHCINRLRGLLARYGNRLVIVGEYTDADTAANAINNLQSGVVFLDVQLGDKTGFDIIRQVSPTACHIVFTTAYEAYAVQAFRVSALDYLLKPIERESLEQAMAKIFHRTGEMQLAQRLEVLLDNLSAENNQRKISIPTAEGYKFLNATDIIRCQAAVNYTVVYTVQGQKYTVSRTLKHFEDLLSPYGFFRIHQTHLINLDHVEKYTRGNGGAVILSDLTTLEVSSRRKEAFLKRMLPS